MVKVTLNLLNIFALRTGKNKIIYEAEKVEDVITEFIKQHKALLDDNLLDKKKKKLNSQMLILLNGKNIKTLKEYKTKLQENDKLYISYPISGG